MIGGRERNAPLLLLALAIAIFIKLAVQEAVQLGERVVEAQVTYDSNNPDRIAYELVDRVRVAVRGQMSQISQLSPFTVEVRAEIPPNAAGATSIVLEPDNVRFANGGDLEVVSIDPNQVVIQVDERVTRAVPVRIDLIGEPAAGARAGSPWADPASARVTGPRRRVDRLERLIAEISLDGHAVTFEEEIVLRSPDALVQVVDPQRALVHVPMEEPELSISFESPPPAPSSNAP